MFYIVFRTRGHQIVIYTDLNHSYQEIQQALIHAEPGDIIRLSAVIFTLEDSLSLDVAGVQIEGEGM